MSEKRPKPGAAQPNSFSLILCKTDPLVWSSGTLAYNHSTITPTMATYSLTATEIAANGGIIRDWFLNNICPLVGPEATAAMKELLSCGESPEFANKAPENAKQFIEKALTHYNALK